MGIAFTPQQRQVIEAPRGNNILVSAAAGSGKTAVLVQRILEKLTREDNPINIDELLVVTFTNAAAAQMKERIQNAIDAALQDDPYNEHLLRQSRLVPFANIMTTDAFCQGLVRRYFHELDIDPSFRVLEETEEKLLCEECVNAVLERAYDSGDEVFLQLVELYGGNRGDRKLEEHIKALHKRGDSTPWPEQWLSEATEALDVTAENIAEQLYFQNMLLMVHIMLDDAMSFLDNAMELCDQPDGPYEYVAALESDREFYTLLMKAESYEHMKKLVDEHTFPSLKAVRRSDIDEELKNKAQAERKAAKSIFEGIKKEFFFADIERYVEMANSCAPLMKKLTELTAQYHRELRVRQREENAYSFSELAHMALDLIVRLEEDGTIYTTEVAEQCRRQYDEIMIDEYQDSNLVQELLYRSISTEEDGEPNMFMVGDVKQSIYKFRMARPELFLEKYYRYEANPSAGIRIDLQNNFRSHPVILEGINRIFRRIMIPQVGGIEYDDSAALYPGEEPSALAMMERRNRFLISVPEEGEGAGLAQERREASIQTIINEIVSLTAPDSVARTKIDGEERPIRYGDIVVLVRSFTGIAYPLIDALQEAGIPARAASMSGYFESREVQTMLSFLRVMDNPLQDIPFATVLRSAIGRFTDEELALLHLAGKNLEEEREFPYLYEVLLYLRDLEPCTRRFAGIKEKAIAFLALYDSMCEKRSFLTVPELLNEIYMATGYVAYVTAMKDGRYREKNLLMLLHKAKQFAKGNHVSLSDFLAHLEHMIKYELNMQNEESSSSVNAVRIMTIHKSKGLEFPVVILADLDKKFNLRDANAELVLHPDYGIGPDYIDAERHTKRTTLQKKLFQRMLKLDALGEELRLLYVAMTRAKEYLTIVGAVSKRKDLLLELTPTVDREDLLYTEVTSAGGYIDWILPALFGGSDTPEKAEMRRELQYIGPDESCEFEIDEWDVVLCCEMEALEVESPPEEQRTQEESDVPKRLEAHYAFEYPGAELPVPPVKVSVSELKHAAMEDNAVAWNSPAISMSQEEPTEPIPAFAQEAVEEKVKGSDRGTLYHRVLELHDYSLPLTSETCKGELDAMVARRQLKEKDLQSISVEQLMKYYGSPIGLRMKAAAAAGMLYREQPFVMSVPAKRVEEKYSEHDTVLVQGIIDAYFEEDGEMVLLDYKTDRTSGVDKPEEMLRGRYEEQLKLYADAISRATGKNVKEKLIYSFGLQKELLL